MKSNKDIWYAIMIMHREGHGPEEVIGDTQNEQTMVIWMNNLRDVAQTLTNDLCFGIVCHPNITHRDMQGGGQI